jgi:hypothetical protein
VFGDLKDELDVRASIYLQSEQVEVISISASQHLGSSIPYEAEVTGSCIPSLSYRYVGFIIVSNRRTADRDVRML